MFSVLISVYFEDSPVFLQKALDSIWGDQDLKPSQIVLVKDGRLTADLDLLIGEWEVDLGGDVITVVVLEENVGLGAALNEGLKYCRHELVARMDSDDISLPNRFAKQVSFMKENPKITASSSQVEEWDEGLRRKKGIRRLPCNYSKLLRFANARSPLSHPVTIFRKQVVMGYGGYPPLRKSQDYALWSLLIVNGKVIGNIPDVLLKMRTGEGLFRRRGWEYFKYEKELLRYQREIGFLSLFAYYRNLTMKFFLRVSPLFFKRICYKILR